MSGGGTLSYVQRGVPHSMSGGYPIPGWGWGYPVPGLGGYPIPCLGGCTLSHVWGILHPRSGGVPHLRSGWGTPPLTWLGYPPSELRWDTPPDLRWGTPPPRKFEQTEIITFPILRMRAVKMSKRYEVRLKMMKLFLGRGWLCTHYSSEFKNAAADLKLFGIVTFGTFSLSMSRYGDG